jgi:hypothetical protein
VNRDELVLAVAGVLLAVGLVIAWSGFRYGPGPTRRRSARRAPVVAGVVGASLVVAVSGWIIPSVIVGVVVGWMVYSMHRGPAGLDVGVGRTEALASWVENVRDVLQSGNQPVGAIGATTETCPPSIRPHVRVLFARLAAGQPAELAFRRFPTRWTNHLRTSSPSACSSPYHAVLKPRTSSLPSPRKPVTKPIADE